MKLICLKLSANNIILMICMCKDDVILVVINEKQPEPKTLPCTENVKSKNLAGI